VDVENAIKIAAADDGFVTYEVIFLLKYIYLALFYMNSQ